MGVLIGVFSVLYNVNKHNQTLCTDLCIQTNSEDFIVYLDNCINNNNNEFDIDPCKYVNKTRLQKYCNWICYDNTSIYDFYGKEYNYSFNASQ